MNIMYNNKLSISKPLFLMALIFGLWVMYLAKSFTAVNLSGQMVAGIISFLIFYVWSGWFTKGIKKLWQRLNYFLDNTSVEKLIGGSAGLLLGALVGLLSSYPFSMISGIGMYLTLATFLLCGFMGVKIGTRRAFDVLGLLPVHINEEEKEKVITQSSPKVVDTSAIIDGRIYDVCISNFLEGSLIVPTFVIEELQHIAGSSDNMRRNKGRRGLELLSKMQKHPDIKIDIMEGNNLDEKEVDQKLIRLCKRINASIITNDYNLNKVAELQGITVLNINELTNAVKVMVYPGESMHITIIKEGKEPGQGIGYLEDGTMVVVEEANHEINNELEVTVTSVFQTAAGRMIFTRKNKDEATHCGIEKSFHDVQEVSLYG
ncbi:MAG: PIN domain-containing protein [Syntrophomonas sp.]